MLSQLQRSGKTSRPYNFITQHREQLNSSLSHSEITPHRLEERFQIKDNPTFRYEPTDSPTVTSSPFSALPVPIAIEDQNIDLRLYEYMAGCREPACSLFRILKLGSIDTGKRGDLAG